MPRRFPLLLGLLLVITSVLAQQEHHRDETAPTQDDTRQLLFAVEQLIDAYYVDTVDRQALLDGALKGMLEVLDPHSSYLNTQTLDLLRENNQGHYYGYGLEVAVDDDHIRVITPLMGSAAEAAGVLPGDILLQVDELKVEPRNLDPLVAYIKQASQEDRDLQVVLQRRSAEQPLEFRLAPSQIEIHTSESAALPEQVGYLRIASFNQRTAQEVRLAARELQLQPLSGLVVDLRNNPGGLLDAAVEVADMFLTEGVIVTTHGRYLDANQRYLATEYNLFGTVPVVVLINQGSASAAEILAGALQDHQRATLVGERSYGKGTVQSLIPLLEPGGAIKLTTARYATPDGRFIDEVGIEPDLAIPLADHELEDIVNNIKELETWKDDQQLYAAYDLLHP
ncbi:S41 family peptidase [Ferrimonas marina]|uniref:Carboxyl-terminal processing protease n=1 Tax=Ferrimonas marina TaxID=299255 RepID=A0A1M5XP73_9GAMM|nr:S41 family peptidase [Ferrimonas marina]SHI01601.1 carboxyl-terminal processing protease [Ferrimonas marina]